MRIERMLLALSVPFLIAAAGSSSLAQTTDDTADTGSQPNERTDRLANNRAEEPAGANYGLRSSGSSTPVLDAIFRISAPGNEPSRSQRSRRGIPASVESLRRQSGPQTFAEPVTKAQSETLSGQVRQDDKSGDFSIFSLFGGLSPLAGTEQQLKSLQDPITNLAPPLQDLKEPISDLRAPINRLREPIVRLAEPVQGLETGVNNLHQPISDLKDPMKNLKQPIENLSQPVKDLREPIAGLKGPVGALTRSTSQLRAPLATVGRELNQMEVPLANLQKPLSGIAQPLGNMNKPLTDLPQPITSLGGSVEKLERQVYGLQSQVGSLNQAIIDISRSISIAIIGSAILIGGAILMHRKIPAVAQPTKTTVEQVVDTPPAANDPSVTPQAVWNRWEQASQLTGSQSSLPAVKTVMTTTPISENEVKKEEAPAEVRKTSQLTKTVQDLKATSLDSRNASQDKIARTTDSSAEVTFDPHNFNPPPSD